MARGARHDLLVGAAGALARWCADATVWFEAKPASLGGYVGAYYFDGLSNPLLWQVAREIQTLLGFDAHPLQFVWAYKYPPSASSSSGDEGGEPGAAAGTAAAAAAGGRGEERSGIPVHKDPARWNVNLWLSPDEASLDRDHNGLVIFDRRADGAQASVGTGQTPRDLWSPTATAARFASLGVGNVTVPYRFNRLVIFDSSLVHASDIGAWRPDYLSRRVSMTFLYGKPTKAA